MNATNKILITISLLLSLLTVAAENTSNAFANTLLKKAGVDWATAKTFEDSLMIHLAKDVVHGVVADLFVYASRQVVTDKYSGNLLQLLVA